MKIRAFTILELVVAMAISATVITIAYYTISSINRVVSIKKAAMISTEQLHEFRLITNYDFSKAYNWSVTDNIIESTNGHIVYEFLENEVRRIGQGRSQSFTFDSVEKMTENYSERNILSTLIVTLKENGSQYVLFFPLNQEAAIKINQSEDFGN